MSIAKNKKIIAQVVKAETQQHFFRLHNGRLSLFLALTSSCSSDAGVYIVCFSYTPAL